MLDKNGKIVWSPRVPQWKVRRLYQTEAQGIYDQDQIDDVGMTLFMRCQDILTIHHAQVLHEVRCPACERQQREVWIPRPQGRETKFTCPVCGWSSSWLDYHRSFKRRQLNPGGAVSAFQHFVTYYPKARTARDKMLLIDGVIHAFHFSLKDQPDLPTRPAGVNLIEGKLHDVVTLLDEISGLTTTGDIVHTHKAWKENYARSYWPDIYGKERNDRSEMP